MAKRTMMGLSAASAWSGLLPVTLLLSACGGSGDSGSSPSPILQVGMQRQYAGTATRTVVYTNPTASSPNNTLDYSFVESQAVQQAPSGTSATFDVHTEYTYTTTQDPGTGSVPLSQTVDTYDNLLMSGNSQTIATVGQNTVAVANDETSNALGGGPYTQTTTTDSSYPNTRYGFSFPLQTGASMNVPQSSSQNISFTDVNASGGAPPDGTYVGYTRTRTENEDGSFSYQTAYVNGNSLDTTQNSDGSGNETFTSSTSSTATTLGLPTASSGTNILLVTRGVTPVSTGVTASTNYSAVDWYPNNGTPDSPLVLQAQTVVGPTSTLPPQCQGALLRPNIYEVDINTTSLGTIGASYSTTASRSFNADGVVVCLLSQQTNYAYDLLTGELTSTTTTDTQAVLSSINY